MTNRSEADWLADVRAAEGAGEFFRAHDLARRGLLEHPESLRLQHRAVLALARSGATLHARQLFDSLGLAGRRGRMELEAHLVHLAVADRPELVISDRRKEVRRPRQASGLGRGDRATPGGLGEVRLGVDYLTGLGNVVDDGKVDPLDVPDHGDRGVEGHRYPAATVSRT